MEPRLPRADGGTRAVPGNVSRSALPTQCIGIFTVGGWPGTPPVAFVEVE